MTSPRPIAIIANGEPPQHAEVLKALAQCQACVCCDRLPPTGAPTLLQVVGDLDSFTGELAPELLTDLHEDQETNDLTKAMNWLAKTHPGTPIDYFAVTGLREDHTLANLALIAEAGRPARVFTESGRFDLLGAGTTPLHTTPNTPISFLSFTSQVISARGVVWPVEHLLLDTLWRATLNRTTASTVEITCERPLFVYRPWKACL